MPYQHFSSDERDRLQQLLYRGYRIATIAIELKRHYSSIYRELQRNRCSIGYISGKAHLKSIERRLNARPKPKRDDSRLMQEIESRLEQDHSPEQISGRLRLEYPGMPSFHVSHETIYKHVYERIRLGATELKSHLRQGRKNRRKRLFSRDKRGIIPQRKFIDERPAVVDKKSRLGDWEGDTIEGSRKRGYVATFVERRSKYCVGTPLRHKTSLLLNGAAEHSFNVIPQKLLKTITVDSGKEFANHKELAALLGARVYFAHPYHSWERGLSEHTNGLLRQYLPKTRRLDNLSEKQLDSILNKLNNRPRKVLNYWTPREVFFRLPIALRT